MDLFRFYKGKKNSQEPPPQLKPKPLKTSLKENVAEIKNVLGDVNDLLVRELELNNGVKAGVIGIDGLIDSEQAQRLIIYVLTIELPLIDSEVPQKRQELFDRIFNSRISMIDASTGTDFNDLYDKLLTGQVVVLIDGVPQCMYFDCKGWEMRSINEPATEKSLRGPKDSFVETIRVNTATLRRRIKDSRLRFDAHQVGSSSKTDVFVAYIEGITNPEYVKIANDRIKKIQLDILLNTSELIQLIEDPQRTIFPRLIETERPDKVAAALMEGQVAIFVDGTPFAILAPFYFTSAFQSIDDYGNETIFASFKRIMRYFCYFAIILTPGFYIALTTFHQEMIPFSLLITIISQRTTQPFSTFVETLIVLILFEILREASLRKPDAIGDSMTIVGSLIIGQTIVEAGLVSYAAIIMGALTTIASFVVSSTKINVPARILTVCFMIVGTQLGFYGITLAFIMLITHMCSLTSFGEPYLAPLAPFNLQDQKDQLVRLPFNWMKKRPQILKSQDQVRHDLPNLEKEDN